MCEWVVSTVQPFNVVESPQFIALLKAVNPSLNLADLTLSADTLKNDILCAFRNEKENVIAKLKVNQIDSLKWLIVLRNQSEYISQLINSKLSFTHDVWTSINQIAFLGMKVHWIGIDYSPQNLLIGFERLKGRHTGENIAAEFTRVLTDFGISLDQIQGITTDSASNNDTYFRALQLECDRQEIVFAESESRVNRTAHALNLAVQDLLTNLRIEASKQTDDDEGYEIPAEDSVQNSTIETKCILKLRRLVRAIRSSPQPREELSAFCALNKVVDNMLIMDVRTRWNSTYFMIKRAITLKIPLLSMCSTESELSSMLL